VKSCASKTRQAMYV